MAISPQWMIERRHADGRWEAVQSYGWLVHTHGRNWTDPLFDRNARLMASDKNDRLFSLLSGLYGQVKGQTRNVVRAQLPEDASEHAEMAYSWRTAVTSPGWVKLADVDAARNNPKMAPTPEDRALLADLHARLTDLIYGPEAVDLTEIIEGPVGEAGTGRPYPAMQDRSNHEKLAKRQRAAGFLPLAEHTIRILIGYDS